MRGNHLYNQFRFSLSCCLCRPFIAPDANGSIQVRQQYYQFFEGRDAHGYLDNAPLLFESAELLSKSIHNLPPPPQSAPLGPPHIEPAREHKGNGQLYRLMMLSGSRMLAMASYRSLGEYKFLMGPNSACTADNKTFSTQYNSAFS